MTNTITRRAVIKEAKKRGWSVTKATANSEYLWIDNNQGVRKLVRGIRIDSDANGFHIAGNKLLTYRYLESNGYQVPSFTTFTDIPSGLAFIRAHGGDIVVKPSRGEQGKGVTVGVGDAVTLQAAVQHATKFNAYDGEVVLQQQLQGELFRLLVVGDRMFAASRKVPAFVTGDDIHTIRELIELKNEHEWRGDDHEAPLTKIPIDAVEQHIGTDAMDSVLPAGTDRQLLELANLSQGGEAEDVTDKVAPGIAKTVVAICRELGLSVCGIDVMCEDISQEFPNGYLPLLEFNVIPGIRSHLYPTAGGIARNPVPLAFDTAFGIDSTV